MMQSKTVTDAILMLKNGEVDKAVVPIENSLQGIVSDTIDILIENDDIFVEKELVLDIKQNLMAKTKLSFDQINRIYSHTQAISQARKYLIEHGLYDRVSPVASTARAAEMVCESNDNDACIGSIACIDEYGMTLLEKDIQDNDFNKTRFWVLSKNDQNIKNGTGNKMSMIFSVKNKPGALFHALKIFNDYSLNLTKIESRPAKTRLGEYIFIIDVEIDGDKYLHAIKNIEAENIYYRILGIY